MNLISAQRGSKVYEGVNVSNLGRMLIAIGLGIALLGSLIWLGSHSSWFGRLPGDVRVERESFKFYFPWVTCLLISVVLTLLLWLLRRR